MKSRRFSAEQVPMIFTVTPYYYAAIRFRHSATCARRRLSYYRVTWNAEELYYKK